MTYEEYTTKFLMFLRYASYLNDEKSKVQIFLDGLPLEFKYWIEYDEPQSLEEFIGKLKHCYEPKHKIESQQGWKWKDKTKGKWQPKRTRPQDASEKENIVSYNKFNGPQLGEQQNRGDGRRQ